MFDFYLEEVETGKRQRFDKFSWKKKWNLNKRRFLLVGKTEQ